MEKHERRLSRFAGACLVLFGLSIILFVAGLAAGGSSSLSSDADLRATAARSSVLWLLIIVVSLGEAALVPAALVLCRLLAPAARIRAGVAAVAVIVGTAIDLTGGAAMEMGKIQVATAYVATSDQVARAAYRAASQFADGGQFATSHLWVFFGGVGLVLFGSAMSRSVFPRLLSYSGVAIGALAIFGVVGGAVVAPLDPVGYIALLLAVAWWLTMGFVLIRTSRPTMGRADSTAPSAVRT